MVPFEVTITDKQMFADYLIRVFQVEVSMVLKLTEYEVTLTCSMTLGKYSVAYFRHSMHCTHLGKCTCTHKEVCYQYWPSSGYKQYGEYSVDLLGEEELEDTFSGDSTSRTSRYS